jgi:hypothetical protein
LLQAIRQEFAANKSTANANGSGDQSSRRNGTSDPQAENLIKSDDDDDHQQLPLLEKS